MPEPDNRPSLLTTLQTTTMLHSWRVQMAAEDTPNWGPRQFATFFSSERHLKLILALLIYLLTYRKTQGKRQKSSTGTTF